MAEETFELDLTIDDSVVIEAQDRLDQYERSIKRISALSRNMGGGGSSVVGSGRVTSGGGAGGVANQSTMFSQIGAQVGTMLGGSSLANRQVDSDGIITPERSGNATSTAKRNIMGRSRERLIQTSASMAAARGANVGGEGIQAARGVIRQTGRNAVRGATINPGRSLMGAMRGIFTGSLRGMAKGVFAGPKGLIAGAVIGGIAGGMADRVADSASNRAGTVEDQATQDRFIRREILRGQRDPRDIVGGISPTGWTWWGDREADGFSGPGWRFNIPQRMQEAARKDHDRRIRGMQTELPETEMEIKRLEDTIGRLLRI